MSNIGRKWKVKEMTKRYMEKLVGKYCKIVTKEPGEERASVVTGILEDVDYKDGFILVDSSQGLGCLRIDTVIAIKPGNKGSSVFSTMRKAWQCKCSILFRKPT